MTVLPRTLIKHDLSSPNRPYYGHMTPELYAAGGHMLISPDVYPPNSYTARTNDQHPNSNYLPSVSYSLDHLDRLDYQVPSCQSILTQVKTFSLFCLFVFFYRDLTLILSCILYRVQKCCPTNPILKAVLLAATIQRKQRIFTDRYTF